MRLDKGRQNGTNDLTEGDRHQYGQYEPDNILVPVNDLSDISVLNPVFREKYEMLWF